MPYFCPAKVGAGTTPKLEAAKIDPGSFAGGVPPDSARLAGADALDSPSPGQFSAELYIFEDNTSTICVLEKGASNKLAHLTRTHRVNLHWLSEVCASQGIHVGHIGTDDQAGDIFTKAFTDPLKWDTLTKLVGMYESNVFRSHQGSSSSGKAKALCLRDFRAEPVGAMSMSKYTTTGKSAYAKDSAWLGPEQSGADSPWQKSPEDWTGPAAEGYKRAYESTPLVPGPTNDAIATERDADLDMLRNLKDKVPILEC